MLSTQECNDPVPKCEDNPESKGTPIKEIPCKSRGACSTYKIVCAPCKIGVDMSIESFKRSFIFFNSPRQECMIRMSPESANLLGLRCQCASSNSPIENQILSKNQFDEIIHNTSLTDSAIARCMLAHEAEHGNHICEIAENYPDFFVPLSCTT